MGASVMKILIAAFAYFMLASAQSTCPRVSSKEAKGHFLIKKIFAKGDKYFSQQFSQCIGSMPIPITQVSHVVGECSPLAANIAEMPIVKQKVQEMVNKVVEYLSSLFSKKKKEEKPQESAVKKVERYMEMAMSLLTKTNQDYEDFCAVMGNADKCFSNALLKLFIKHADQHECCVDIRRQFLDATGTPLAAESMEPFFYSTKNMFCSTRENPKTQQKELCGYSLAQAIIPQEIEKDPSKVLQMVSIMDLVRLPDEQACNAFMGKSFDTTDAKNHYFERSIDCCAGYVDQFFTLLGSTPHAKKHAPALFETGKRLMVEDTHLFDPKYRNITSSALSFHFPNGFSKSCASKFEDTCSAVRMVDIELEHKVFNQIPQEVIQGEDSTSQTNYQASSGPILGVSYLVIPLAFLWILSCAN